MIDYLIKSALCLIILLAVYRLYFENEKMHRFNRFFLLLSLAFGLMIPVVSLNLFSGPLKTFEFSYLRQVIAQPVSDPTISRQIASDTGIDYMTLLLIIYGVVAGFLAIKFLLNLIRIASNVSRCPKINTEKGVIILQEEKVVPHSFLKYVFLNKDDYSEKHIEDQIITHEFTHVSQKHSIDILIIELLKILFWFNPVFRLYKKAIQLNHEFLADEAVITSCSNISAYQQLLLETASLKPVQLASNFNYSITKKRLIMMEKQPAIRRAMLKITALIPLIAVLMFSCSNSSSDNALKDRYYAGAYIELKNTDSSSVTKKYEQLTSNEKSGLPAPLIPSTALIEEWKNAEKYHIGIDFNYAANDSLINYQATDFASYYVTNPNNKSTFIDLITSKTLESFKKLGGMFVMDGGELTLKLPPPVIKMPAPPPPPPPPPAPKG